MIRSATTVMSACVWLSIGIFPACSEKAQESSGTADISSGQNEKTADRARRNDEFSLALQPWKGDYDEMVQRKMVRILVPYSMTHYFLDGATERGIMAAAGREFEQEINRSEGLRTRLVRVVFIPVPTNQLIPWLEAGRGDIAAGSLTITENRKLVVDFSEPVLRNSAELVVTGPGAPALESIEDLAGKEVYVKTSSVYAESLKRLNQDFEARGLAPIEIEPVDELLEPDEILELAQAGLIPITVMDRHLAEFWGQVFPDLTVHSQIIVAAERDIAWAFRKGSPILKEKLDEFLTPRRHRTTFGNMLFRRYLQNLTWVKNPTATADQVRFDQTMPFFRKYGELYDLDPLFLAALGYQESRLDQDTRSPAGAIGVMQLLPSTGAALEVGDIRQLEPNIHAGSRYLRYVMDAHASGPDVDRLNRTLFALASYNAGPTRIRRLRNEAAGMGLDPNVWFNNVELVVAREIGRETVQYVRNVYKYFLTYQKVEQNRAQRLQRRAES